MNVFARVIRGTTAYSEIRQDFLEKEDWIEKRNN